MTPTRKAIAKAMVNSKHTAPHVTLHDEVEVSKFRITVRNLKMLLLQWYKINILTIRCKSIDFNCSKIPNLECINR